MPRRLQHLRTLINAGFTKSEITAMLSEAPEPKQEAPAKAASAVNPEQTDAKPQGNANIPSLDLSGLNTAIDDLTKKIQKINLSAAELPEPESIQKKADDILASIINPPRAGK